MGSRREPVTSGKIAAALRSYSKRPQKLIQKDANEYELGYLALRSLIRDRTDSSDLEQLRAAAYAVYGWMPTILKRSELGGLSDFISSAKKLSKTKAIASISNLLGSRNSAVMHCINNSVVGTSKLLHFSLPNVFPIWDSKIAETLFGHKWQSHNKVSAYREYFDAMHVYCDANPALSANNIQLLRRSAPHNDPLTNIRLVEYALYLEASIRAGTGPAKAD